MVFRQDLSLSLMNVLKVSLGKQAHLLQIPCLKFLLLGFDTIGQGG